MRLPKFNFTRPVCYPALLVVFLFAPSAIAATCQSSTDGVDSMDSKDVVIERAAGENLSFEMLVADENDERAAGFQHICPEVIEDTLILFIFPRDYLASFHMRNVHAPLDIAFIDSTGLVIDIQTMHPYVLGARDHPLYSPPSPARAALEADVGFFESNGIEAGTSRVLFDAPGVSGSR